MSANAYEEFFQRLPQYAGQAEEEEHDRLEVISDPYPIEAFPENLQQVIREYSRFNRTPISVNASTALAVLSACCGRRLRMETFPGKEVASNLYMMIFMPSGMGKSETLRSWLVPMHGYERFLFDRAKAETATARAKVMRLEGDVKALQAALKKSRDFGADKIEKELATALEEMEDAKKAMRPPQLLVSNTTTESLAKIMEANDEFAFSVAAEGKIILANILGKYSENGEPDEALYLNAFSGDFYRSDRITREQVTLEQPYLTCLWAAQNSVLHEMLKQRRLTEGGLLPRFMICACNGPIPQIDPDALPLDPNIEDGWQVVCAELIKKYNRGKEFCTIPRPEPVFRVFLGFHNALLGRMSNGLADVASFAARWCEFAYRVAAVLHAAEHGPEAHKVPLSVQEARNAIRIVQWYAAMQTTVMAPQVEDAAYQRAEKLANILKERYRGSAPTRIINRSHGFKSDEVQILAQKFPDLLQLEQMPSPQGSPRTLISCAQGF